MLAAGHHHGAQGRRRVGVSTLDHHQGGSGYLGVGPSMPVFLERDVEDDYLAPVKLDDSGKDEMVALLTAESEKVASTISNYEVDRRVNNSQAVDPTDATLIEPLDA